MKTLLSLLSLTICLTASAQTLPPIHVECVQDSLTQPIHVKCVQVWRNAEAVPSRMPAQKSSDDYNIKTRDHGERFTLSGANTLDLNVATSRASVPASSVRIMMPDGTVTVDDLTLTISFEDVGAILETLTTTRDGDLPSVMALRMKRATAERLIVTLALALGEKPKRETTP